jgi:hypothetical protein
LGSLISVESRRASSARIRIDAAISCGSMRVQYDTQIRAI